MIRTLLQKKNGKLLGKIPKNAQKLKWVKWGTFARWSSAEIPLDAFDSNNACLRDDYHRNNIFHFIELGILEYLRKLIMAKKRKEARNIMKFGKNVDLERKYFDVWKTKGTLDGPRIP